MYRDRLAALSKWAQSPIRVPLILRGARQVGKSWLVNELAKQFDQFITLNFDKQKSLAELFKADINIPRLLERLSLYFGKPIVPGKTLIFFDEIQECEAAIGYLRYFKEEFPQLHVIAAGSLIDFQLEKIGLPVGRVDFLYLFPLSFAEFLSANNRDDLRNFLYQQENDPALDLLLKEYLKTYIWLGGMPEVISTWLTTKNTELCQQIQDRIIQAYKDDFEKYAKRKQIPYIEKIFSNIPLQLGEKFTYSKVDKEIRSQNLKEALFLLEKAGIALPCYHSSGQNPPLAANKDDKRFKVFFFDLGLSQRILGLKHQDWIINAIKVDNIGGLAEQFVAQELVAYQSCHEKCELFYWHREAKNSNAEVDFLAIKNSKLIPIEVKSGKKGHLKSMHAYLAAHPSAAYGLKISESGFAQHGSIHEIPLYAIESWIKETD